ncbi:hypothetical protein [Duganella sp. LjRoot269]|uniref:hypothetical protein n=1 Tax=Duganella sp. LjRoot269 TaxID=3342305 RepID=UPI003ECC8516
MIDRTVTDRIANALCSAGVAVRDIVRRTHPQESDVLRLDDDYYVALGYDDFERAGIVHVSLDQSMHSGGDVEIDSWMVPDVSHGVAVAEIAAYRVQKTEGDSI